MEAGYILYIAVGWFMLMICAFVYAERLGRAGIAYALISIPFPLLTLLLLACLGEYKGEK